MMNPEQIKQEQERVKGLLEGTTEGAWYWEEDDKVAQLFARRLWPWPEHYADDLKEFAPEGMELHPLQILKAPKTGTPYAEYWPAEKDAALIAHAPTLARQYADLLSTALALLDRAEAAEARVRELGGVLDREERLAGAMAQGELIRQRHKAQGRFHVIQAARAALAGDES